MGAGYDGIPVSFTKRAPLLELDGAMGDVS